MPRRVDREHAIAIVRRSLELLAECGISQRRVERALGLSQSYLSRLKRGRGIPKTPVLVLLHMLGQKPQRIESLERFLSRLQAADPSSNGPD